MENVYFFETVKIGGSHSTTYETPKATLKDIKEGDILIFYKVIFHDTYEVHIPQGYNCYPNGFLFEYIADSGGDLIVEEIVGPERNDFGDKYCNILLNGEIFYQHKGPFSFAIVCPEHVKIIEHGTHRM